MNYFPSPPSSPTLNMTEKAVCGSCEKTLESDWYCTDCHTKCNTCNRFLSQYEYCSRCWIFDTCTNQYIRKERSKQYHQQSKYHSFYSST